MARRNSSSRPEDRRRSRQHDTSGRNQHRKKRSRDQRPNTGTDESRGDSSHALSSEALAQLERRNQRDKRKAERTRRTSRGANYHEVEQSPRRERERTRDHDRERRRERTADAPREKPQATAKDRKKRRVVSGAIMEEGRARGSGLRGGRGEEHRWSEQSLDKEDYYHRPKAKKGFFKKNKKWIILAVVSVLLIIVIAVAVAVSQKNKGGDDDSGSSSLDGQDRSNIPDEWKNTFLDPWTWETTEDFNTTFTAEMIGDLPVMGLNMDWDDSKRANDKVPPLNEPWGDYAKKPARGVSVGGWLALEPFITPSMFDYASDEGVIDEWNLCLQLGHSKSERLEKHYAEFITEDDFKAIADAGLDHIRIPFSYWAVEIYDEDPYLWRTSWRYLLRGIEWARKYGLRVKLDLHGLPGSQNGWNHSGRYGAIGWLNGTDGELNGERSLDIHDRLSKFFSQDRYKNVISHYGLANEPKMTDLKSSDVIAWTEKAYKTIRDNGVKALAVFGDGFMGLENWQGKMTGYDDMVLDVHQYVIFNNDQIAFSHTKKVEYACQGWTDQAELSLDTSTGYGPTLFAEWSQADTDCQPLLNHGFSGARWDGTLASVDEPKCPEKDDSCSCSKPNEDPSNFSDEYKKFLQMFAEAQMHSFEKGWGWWYWTWKTETAPLWSYKWGLQAKILPEKAYKRSFNCDMDDIPDFEKQGLEENI